MISKEDWKVYQTHIVDWQENYIEHLLDEYSLIIKEKSYPSKRFWRLINKINKDKMHPGVRVTLSKKDAIDQIVSLLLEEVITIDDLKVFSSELQSEVKNRIRK